MLDGLAPLYLFERRIEITDGLQTVSVGYIYVLTNPSIPGLVKIGYTNRDVKERVDELSGSTGVPTAFLIEYYCLTRDVENVEIEVHKHFARSRQPGKEFFSISVVEAARLIDTLVKNVEPDRFCRVSITKDHVGHGDPTYVLYQCPKCGERNASSKQCAGCGAVYG